MKSVLAVAPAAVIALLCGQAHAAYPAEPAVDAYEVGAYYFAPWTPANDSPDKWTFNQIYNDDPGDTSLINSGLTPASPLYVPLFWGGTAKYDHLYPALGWYDSGATATLEAQIRQARSNGLDFFNFYWYWDGVAHTERSTLDRGLRAFEAARNTEDLEFAISLVVPNCCAGEPLNMPESDFPAAVNAIVGHVARSNYLKTTDGRPIIYLINIDGIGIDALSSAPSATQVADRTGKLVQQLRAAISSRLGLNPYFAVSAEAIDPTQPALRAALGVEAASCLTAEGASSISPTRWSFTQQKNNLVGWYQYVSNGAGNMPVLPCFAVDFNERPRQRAGRSVASIRYFVEHEQYQDASGQTIPESSPLFNYGTAEQKRMVAMQQSLAVLKAFMDGASDHNTVADRYLTLYSWNEWTEGGHVAEPSYSEANKVLSTVASTLGLNTFGDTNCQWTGNCQTSSFNPAGALESVTCQSVSGWARDADTSVPLDIHIYKGGPYGVGTYVTTLKAEQLRADLTQFRDRRHGFSAALPAQFVTGKSETLYAYGINVNANGTAAGTNVLLAGAPKSITCGAAPTNTATPTGSLDVASCATLAGWARDADTTGAIQVHIYKGGPYGTGTFVTAVTANLYRGDLPFTDKSHGFSIPLPAAFKTGQSVPVYVYGINVDSSGAASGSSPLLNGVPKTVICAP